MDPLFSMVFPAFLSILLIGLLIPSETRPAYGLVFALLMFTMILSLGYEKHSQTTIVKNLITN